MKPFTIALPAGRMAEESIEFFKKANVANFDLTENGRALSVLDETGKFRILLVRNQDVPVCVLQGGADIGVTGRDVLAERGYDLTVPLELGFGKCRLSIATTSEMQDKLFKKGHIRVATKYPKLTKDYFFKRGLSCEVMKMHGSVEIAPLADMSDCIVDLVSTGNTLKANGLVELDVILYSSAMLVANRAVYALHFETMRGILSQVRNTRDNGGQNNTSGSI